MDDGELRWISVNARALREDGVVTGSSRRSSTSPSSARSRQPRAGRRAATRFRVVLDATTQYAIIGTDADGLITVFNGGAELMLGYRAADLVGLHRPELFHDPGGARAPGRRVRRSRRIRARARHAPARHGHARLDARAQATASSCRCRSRSRPSAPPTARSPATSASGATSRPSARRRASCATPRSASATPSTRRRSARRWSRRRAASRASTARSAASLGHAEASCSARRSRR